MEEEEYIAEVEKEVRINQQKEYETKASLESLMYAEWEFDGKGLDDE